MKICVPSSSKGGLDDLVGQHFGRVPTYTIKDTETNEIRTIENKSEHMGGVGLPPELLSQEGIDVMLCGGLGTRLYSSSNSLVYKYMLVPKEQLKRL